MSKLKKRPMTQDQNDRCDMMRAANDAGEGLQKLTASLTALRQFQDKPLNEIELRAVSSMISYVAHVQSFSTETVSAVLSLAFGAKNILAIPSRHYPEVMAYLTNIEVAKALN